MRIAVTIARVGLGALLLMLSLQFLFATGAAHSFAKTGYGDWVRWLLGIWEALGALLFMIPKTKMPGGLLLLGSLLLAIVLHLGLHQLPHSLVLFAAAVGGILWMEKKGSVRT